jgi:hypothetical protein
MAYCRKNLLTRIVEIQKITLEQKKKGLTQKRIYETMIGTQYFISASTFNNYMSVNARKELADIERAKAETK